MRIIEPEVVLAILQDNPGSTALEVAEFLQNTPPWNLDFYCENKDLIAQHIYVGLMALKSMGIVAQKFGEAGRWYCTGKVFVRLAKKEG